MLLGQYISAVKMSAQLRFRDFTHERHVVATGNTVNISKVTHNWLTGVQKGKHWQCTASAIQLALGDWWASGRVQSARGKSVEVPKYRNYTQNIGTDVFRANQAIQNSTIVGTVFWHPRLVFRALT